MSASGWSIRLFYPARPCKQIQETARWTDAERPNKVIMKLNPTGNDQCTKVHSKHRSKLFLI